MFLMLPCPTITDNVKFIPQDSLSKQIPNLNQTRKLLTQLSDTSTLINRVQGGEVIIQHKIKFDEYLKSHVDMMKLCVKNMQNCQFKYNGFATSKPINTTLLGIKQQWGIEIMMTRYILSSVYIGGSIQSIGRLFEQTIKSHDSGYKNTSEFTKNLQITYKYFNQGFDPLKRLYPVIESVEQLFSQSTKDQYLQCRSSFFKFFAELIQTNLAYLKLQKYRILCEYKSCKQGAWAVYERFKDLKAKLNNFSEFEVTEQIQNYINLGIVFYKSYALYSLLLQNQSKKTQQEYGFIKKQFQEMINENLVIADEIINLKTIMGKLPGQELDNVIFANMVLQVMVDHAQKTKYRYDIEVHQTKSQRPHINTITMKILSKNIWDSLAMF